MKGQGLYEKPQQITLYLLHISNKTYNFITIILIALIYVDFLVSCWPVLTCNF